MKKHGLHVLVLQETHINTNSIEHCNGFTLIFSTSITDDQRKAAENRRAQAAAPQKGKGKTRIKGRGQRTQAEDIEYGGVGCVLSPLAFAALQDFIQYSGRLMSLALLTCGPPVHIINVYAPQSGCDTIVKTTFYQKAEQVLNSFPRARPTFLAGDFNARLHDRLPEETGVLGEHILGRGPAYLNRLNGGSLENRTLFMDFCIANSLCISNTLFRKPASRQITFREPGTCHALPWTPDKFAQLDFLLAPDRWKNAVKDVFSQTDFFAESDHYLVISLILVTLKQPTVVPRRAPKFRISTIAQNNTYNTLIFKSITGKDSPNMVDFLNAMTFAAKESFIPISTQKRRSYLSQHTWDLILRRQEAHATHDYQTVKFLTTQIKRQARKDKQQFIHTSLLESTDQRTQWNGIKNLQRKHPRLSHIVNQLCLMILLLSKSARLLYQS